MRFVLIGQELHTLPVATSVDGNSLEEAKEFVNKFIREAHGEWETIIDEDGNPSYQKQGTRIGWQSYFLIDMEKGEVRRTFFNENRELQLTNSESAFKPLGIGTDNRFFMDLVEEE